MQNGDFLIGAGYFIKGKEVKDCPSLSLKYLYESARWLMRTVVGECDLRYVELFYKFREVAKGYECFSKEDITVPEDICWLRFRAFDERNIEEDVIAMQNRMEKLMSCVEAYLENSIYLVGQDDGTYKAVCSKEPVENGVFLVKEQEYPVTMFYVRYDMNGSAIVEETVLEDREKLLETLNFAGEAGWQILTLWDFNLRECVSDEVFELFDMSSRQARDKSVEAMYSVLRDEEFARTAEKHYTASDPDYEKELNVYATFYLTFNDDNFVNCEQAIINNGGFDPDVKKATETLRKKNFEWFSEIMEKGSSAEEIIKVFPGAAEYAPGNQM